MSFVELLVAVGLLGILITVGLFAVEWVLPDWRVREAAGSLASTLRAARTEALTERVAVAVDLDVASGRFVMLHDGATDQLRVVELAPGVTFVHPLGELAVTLEPPGTGDTTALFEPSGRLLSATTPGHAHLGDPARQVYVRVGVNVAGDVFTETWEDGEWR